MNTDELISKNIEHEKTIQALSFVNKELLCENEELKGKVETLDFQLRKALLARFGSKSEKLTDAEKAQLDLFIVAALDAGAEEEPDEAQIITVPKHTRKKTSGRNPLPENLKRVSVIHDLPEEKKICPCSCQMGFIREEKSEQLNYIPESLEVIENIRYLYGCQDGCKQHMAIADLPSTAIPRSIATPSLIANIITNKYEYHLPFYRQEQKWKRRDINISRTLMANWTNQCGNTLVKPLIECIKSEIVASDYMQADETTCQVLKEEGKEAQTKSYIWLYRSHQTKTNKNSLVLYEYQPSRGAVHPTQMLEDFSGYLQTDDYSSYDGLKNKEDVIGLACLDHCRRKFMDIIKVVKKTGKAHQSLSFIQKLYKIESDIKDKSFKEIKAVREEKAKPILDAWHKWLTDTLPTCPPKGPLGKAIGYTLGVWKYLVNYLDEGFLKISNILIENNVRPIALGRKNWLFFDTVDGATAGCAWYTLIENAKMYKLNPEKYITFVLEKMPMAKTLKDVEILLPYNVRSEDLDKIGLVKPKEIDSS